MVTEEVDVTLILTAVEGHKILVVWSNVTWADTTDRGFTILRFGRDRVSTVTVTESLDEIALTVKAQSTGERA